MREWIKNIDDNDLYVIKRAFIDSTFDTVMERPYSKEHKELHTDIINEIIEESTRRTK